MPHPHAPARPWPPRRCGRATCRQPQWRSPSVPANYRARLVTSSGISGSAAATATRPARGLTCQRIQMASPVRTERLDRLVGTTPVQLDGDRTVRQCRRPCPDQCDAAGSEGRKTVSVLGHPGHAQNIAALPVPRVQIPRSSSLTPRNVSASSMSKHGLYLLDHPAAGVTFEASSRRSTRRDSTSSGELMLSRGEKRKCSARNVRKFLSGIRRQWNAAGCERLVVSGRQARQPARPKAYWIP